MSQLKFPALNKFSLTHGGEERKKKRKIARPIATKRPMHLVFRARRSLLHGKARAILSLQQRLAKRNDLTIYSSSNNGNHLHLVVRGKHRAGIRNFMRVFAGQVAQLVTGAVKGKAAVESFWELPVWSRIVEWGKAFYKVLAYVRMNQLEAAGVIPYTPRKNSRRAVPRAALARGFPPGTSVVSSRGAIATRGPAN